MGKRRVPEPRLLHVDGFQLHRVHDIDPDKVQELDVVEVELQVLPILLQQKYDFNKLHLFWVYQTDSVPSHILIAYELSSIV